MCKDIICRKIVINNFCYKKKREAITQKKIGSFFKKLCVLLVKVLNITLSDQNRNKHIFYKKEIPKLKYIHLNFLFLA